MDPTFRAEVDETGGHLAPPRVVDAHEENLGLLLVTSLRSCTRSLVLAGTPVAGASARSLQRAPHHRLVMRVRFSGFAGVALSHSPEGARIHAFVSSASALSRIAWISCRTRAFSTGTSTSMR